MEIKIYCDSRDGFFNLLDSFPYAIDTRDSQNQPILKWKYRDINFTAYADFTNTNLPDKVTEILLQGCRPDFIFYNQSNDKIDLMVEDTATAPVGNAQKQRLPRYIIPYIKGIPFIFSAPSFGYDQSQSSVRKITGILKSIIELNPNSYIEYSDLNFTIIVDDLINNNLEKYKLTKMVSLETKFKKTRVSVKKTDSSFLNEVISIVNSDSTCENIFEKNGNIFNVKSDSNLSKKLNINSDFILYVGSLWKPNGGYSDPAAGSLYSLTLLNSISKNKLPIVVLSTHSTNIVNTSKAIEKNNKMVQALENCNFLFDGSGDKINLESVIYQSNEIFSYRGDSESLVTYIRCKELKEQNEEITFYHFPHGSWSSKNGLNDKKRDEKRGDIECKSKPNGIEVKYLLSDVIRDISKYGIIHDEYTYMKEDCLIPTYLKEKLYKVTF